jgi:hypothetical protein
LATLPLAGAVAASVVVPSDGCARLRFLMPVGRIVPI